MDSDGGTIFGYYRDVGQPIEAKQLIGGPRRPVGYRRAPWANTTVNQYSHGETNADGDCPFKAYSLVRPPSHFPWPMRMKPLHLDQSTGMMPKSGLAHNVHSFPTTPRV